MDQIWIHQKRIGAYKNKNDDNPTENHVLSFLQETNPQTDSAFPNRSFTAVRTLRSRKPVTSRNWFKPPLEAASPARQFGCQARCFLFVGVVAGNSEALVGCLEAILILMAVQKQRVFAGVYDREFWLWIPLGWCFGMSYGFRSDV